MFDLRHLSEQDSFQARGQLSIAQLIALRSLDEETAALIWLMLEHGASLTVAGPTEPRPGAGKSTALQALLQFLPQGAALVYTAGMSETFSFTRLPNIDPGTIYAFCSEISDHQYSYMWGSIARRYLLLASQGYHIVTCTHADTVEDVIHLYQHNLHLRIENLRCLGLIINTGLLGEGESTRRRWPSTYFLQPRENPQRPEGIEKLRLSTWNEQDDSFTHADAATIEQLADWTGISPQNFTASLTDRIECLKQLTQGDGADILQTYNAIKDFRSRTSARTV